jgi:adenylate kinase family enzyme
MNRSPKYYKPVVPLVNNFKVEIWDNVLKLFESGKYKESLVELITYINPELPAKTANAERTEFSIPHGSIVVNIKIDDEKCFVNVPFLKLPEQNKILILRKINEVNFSPLVLAQIVLEGENLYFRYSSSLNLCEPYKMYSLFREICINADNLDDQLIEKFGAGRFQEPLIEKLSDDENEKAWSMIQNYIKETESAIKYYESKRQYTFVWYTLALFFLKFDNLMLPQGILRTDIEEIITALNNRNINLHSKNERGFKFFNKIKSMSQSELLENLYISEDFIPIRYTFNEQDIRTRLTKSLEYSKSDYAAGDYVLCNLAISYDFLDLVFKYLIPAKIMQHIEEALLESSDKSWAASAKTLLDAMEDIVNDNIKDKKKGFFGSFFK